MSQFLVNIYHSLTGVELFEHPFLFNASLIIETINFRGGINQQIMTQTEREVIFVCNLVSFASILI